MEVGAGHCAVVFIAYSACCGPHLSTPTGSAVFLGPTPRCAANWPSSVPSFRRFWALRRHRAGALLRFRPYYLALRINSGCEPSRQLRGHLAESRAPGVSFSRCRPGDRQGSSRSCPASDKHGRSPPPVPIPTPSPLSPPSSWLVSIPRLGFLRAPPIRLAYRLVDDALPPQTFLDLSIPSHRPPRRSPARRRPHQATRAAPRPI